MDILDFYDIAEYANNNWKGGFSPRELCGYAYEYLLAYEQAVDLGYCENGDIIDTLIYQLVEDYVADGNPIVGNWLERISDDLNFQDIEELIEVMRVSR